MKIFKNFLSQDEIEILKNWILLNKDTNNFQKVFQTSTNRKTTRFSDKIEYPKVAYEIQNRIIDHLQIKDFKYPPFPDGMVASVAYEGDKCFAHTDPTWYPDTETIHCNVIIQNSDGAEITVDGIKYNLPAGDLMCYNVCKSPHEVGEVLNNPRFLWIFGFSIPTNDWERIK